MRRILVIDDDPAIREMLRDNLESAGYEILEAGDGETGERMFGETPVDLVITDIIMPGREGVSMLKSLRTKSPEVRIIAISGGGHISPETYLGIARKFGADLTFEKPFKIKTLLAAVERMIGPGQTHCAI